MKWIDRDSVEMVGEIDIPLALQRGVWVTVPDTVEAATVSGFVCQLLMIDPESFRNEIKTAFLNHKVVDDPAHTRVKPGDTLILSGAMPGLVGAMLRSDSPLKVLRAGIAAGEINDSSPGNGNQIRLKLFNTVLKNHQADLIKYGFFVEEPETVKTGETGGAVEIRLFATLRRIGPPVSSLPLRGDETIQTVIDRLAIPADQISIIFLNGKHAELKETVSSGDLISLFPPVGGG